MGWARGNLPQGKVCREFLLKYFLQIIELGWRCKNRKKETKQNKNQKYPILLSSPQPQFILNGYFRAEKLFVPNASKAIEPKAAWSL